jgi:hypothetical protein
MSQLTCRCQRTKYQLTQVNGIKRKPNGKYSVYLRLIGEGTTRLLAENAPTYERGVEIRDLAIRVAGVPASAVGLTRVPLSSMLSSRRPRCRLSYTRQSEPKQRPRCRLTIPTENRL